MTLTPNTTDQDWQLELIEWIASLEEVIEDKGDEQAADLIRKLRAFAIRKGVKLAGEALTSPYINTINVKHQPPYPGNTELELKIENINRWNAMAMVLQAYDSGEGLGGHIATYASAASMYEVGLNHFFRKKSADYGGDLVSFQPHAAPGIYARAMLEGRMTEEQLKNFRRELNGGLPSYPHPRRLPWFWEIPSASMGLVGVSAIYQARFKKYLENRGLKENNGGKVWVFVGDGAISTTKSCSVLVDTSGAQEITARRASSSGLMISRSSPVSLRTRLRKFLPFDARRQASVATSRLRFTLCVFSFC